MDLLLNYPKHMKGFFTNHYNHEESGFTGFKPYIQLVRIQIKLLNYKT